MENDIKPKISYCRSRCRGQIKYAIIGSLIVLLSLLTVIYIVFFDLRFDDNFTTILALILSPIFLLVGGIVTYMGVKDALFLEKSSLAKSIRSQLDSNWDRVLPIEELFAEVDKDIVENGRFFGSLMIGSEWILGDTAMRVDRVRAVFYKMEYHTSNNKSYYSYTLTLYDHNRAAQIHSMRSEDTMMQAYRQICVMAPEAFCGHASRESQLPEGSDFARFNGDIEERQGLRQAQQADKVTVPQDLILFSSDGNVTSRVTEEALTQALTSLSETGTHFRLRGTRQLEYQFGILAFLNCGRTENSCYLMCAFEQTGNKLEVYRTRVNEDSLKDMVFRFVYQKEIPDVYSWEHRTMNMEGE